MLLHAYISKKYKTVFALTNLGGFDKKTVEVFESGGDGQ